MPGRQDTRPLHAKVAAHLRAQIMAGRLPADAQLPSTAQLIQRYEASNATVQRAIAVLREEGFVRTAAGKGVFVCARQPLVVHMSGYIEPTEGGFAYELLDVTETVAPPDVAAEFELPEGGTAVLRHRLMRHAGIPVELSWSWYPSDIARGTALAVNRKIRGGAPALLARHGHAPTDFTDHISSRLPTTEEVIGLDLPEDVPVLRQWRIVRAADRIVEVSELVKGGHVGELSCTIPAF